MSDIPSDWHIPDWRTGDVTPLTKAAAPTPSDEGEVSGKKYKFSVVDNPEGLVEDYTGKTVNPDDLAQEPGPPGPGYEDKYGKEGEDLSIALGGNPDPTKLTPDEYDKLTKEAHNGNKLAQDILVKGDYQAKDYPSLAQDTKAVEQPFANALSALPGLATAEQAQANQETQMYDFSNAEAQVNNLVKQAGVGVPMTTSPETNTYLSKLAGIENQGANNLSTSAFGLPTIEQALGGLGPAAKESMSASPYASLLAALLSHQQYETVYGGVSPSSSGDPAWLQNLIAAVTGSTSTGGLVSPLVAAAGVGSTPTTGASPTGSNA